MPSLFVPRLVTPNRGFSLGRKFATYSPGWRSRTIHAYATLPTAPASFDHTNGLDNFQMLGNGPDPTLTVNGGQPVGDCGVVATVNISDVDAAETGLPFTYPSSDEVVTEYLKYDHGKDEGVDIWAFAGYWQQVGLPWAPAIVGRARVDYTKLELLYEAMNAFGCLYLGIGVPEPMDEQAASGEIIDLTGTRADKNILGGHAIVGLSRMADVGNGQPGGEIATWGMRCRYTDRWLAYVLDEAIVVVTEQQAAKGGNGYSLDLQQMEADEQAVAA